MNFLFLSYSSGIKIRLYTPKFPTKVGKVYTCFQTKKVQKPYLMGRHIPKKGGFKKKGFKKGVLPPPLPVETWDLWDLKKFTYHFCCFVFVVQFIGLFNAAHDVNIEWVIVKGISHFSDDGSAPSESWKSFASIMAASLVSNMLSDPVVFKEWPHYEGM